MALDLGLGLGLGLRLALTLTLTLPLTLTLTLTLTLALTGRRELGEEGAQREGDEVALPAGGGAHHVGPATAHLQQEALRREG